MAVILGANIAAGAGLAALRNTASQMLRTSSVIERIKVFAPSFPYLRHGIMGYGRVGQHHAEGYNR